MKRLPLKERIGLGLLLAMLVTNPLTGQYVMQGIEVSFQYVFKYGAWVSLVATIYLVLYMGSRYVQSEKLRVPAKSKASKVKASEYITS